MHVNHTQCSLSRLVRKDPDLLEIAKQLSEIGVTWTPITLAELKKRAQK